MKQFLLYLWQLPQNLIGLLLIAYYKPENKHILNNGVKVYFSKKFQGGISLGKYAIVNSFYYRKDLNKALQFNIVKHEAIGHTKQSKMLGWVYLLIIGLPSIVWAGMYGFLIKETHNGYYKFYTEKWADKLANIKR